MALRILAVAAATGRVAYVYLVGDRLMDWKISGAASKSPEAVRRAAEGWIEDLTPDVVVTERVMTAAKKGDRAKALIAAVAAVAGAAPLLDVELDRVQRFPNKYAEASALGERYAEIRSWVPKKRRFFDNEHRNTVLFEALALADEVLREPTPALARAMG